METKSGIKLGKLNCTANAGYNGIVLAVEFRAGTLWKKTVHIKGFNMQKIYDIFLNPGRF